MVYHPPLLGCRQKPRLAVTPSGREAGASRQGLMIRNSALVAGIADTFVIGFRPTGQCGLNIDGNGSAKVSWSCTLGGSAHAIGSAVTLPAALNIANTSLIWGEASYTYTPTIGYVVTGTLNLADKIYMRPRLTDSITASC